MDTDSGDDFSDWITESQRRRKQLASVRKSPETSAIEDNEEQPEAAEQPMTDENLSEWIVESKQRRRQLTKDRKTSKPLDGSKFGENQPSIREVEDVSTWIAESRQRRKQLVQTRGPSDTTSVPAEVVAKGSPDVDDLSEWIAQSKQRRKQLSKQRSSALGRHSKKISAESLAELAFPETEKIPDQQILLMLKEQLLLMGFDISSYEEKYLKRRLRILLRKLGLATYREFLNHLLVDPAEYLEKTKRVLSINVTRFLRNFDSWWVFQEKVFPSILSQEFGDSPARIWSAGCAMGPEPYSMAMLIHKYRAEHSDSRKVEILATDINPDLLELARIGEYSSATLEETPPYFQTKYFELVDDLFRVKPEIRSMVQFRQHDLFSSVSTGKHNAIICRNVMIYFNREQKERILRSFAESLISGGFLFLGGAETLPPSFHGAFNQIEFKHRIYQRI
ncbi:MAG: CheR family methyltransferase [Candidatus Hodarchaeales archaeon]|jgi:chemotaxis protein methyltransferase CheR